MKFRVVLLATLLVVTLACEKAPERKKTYSHVGPREPVALVIAEWNGKPYITASAFLVKKERGVFLTAKHFTDALFELGTERCMLFFNGVVYEAVVTKIPPLRDAAAITIDGGFNPDSFPEPYRISKSGVRRGERIFVKGMHPHPLFVRESNAADGFPDKVIDILKGYYGIEMYDAARETEIVFDDIPARVAHPRVKIRLARKDDDDWRKLRDEANYYIKTKTDRNHKFSFGGLSGGPATNTVGELVGLVTAEDVVRLEFDDKGHMIKPAAKITAVADTIYITPIGEIKELYAQIIKLD